MKTIAAATPSPFALFFSSVEGRIVSRYGTGTRGSGNLLIGATRAPDGVVTWDEEEIVALTHHEAAKYPREYARAVRDGSLRKRSEADYLALQAAGAEREQRTLAAAAKAEKDAAAAEKKRSAAEKPTPTNSQE